MRITLTVVIAVGLAAPAQAGAVSHFYGDVDGFGIGAPEVDGALWVSDFGGVFFTDYRDADDIANGFYTDWWDSHNNDITWTYTYTVPDGLTSANLHIYIAGFADIGAVTLNLDGSALTIFDFSGQFQTSHILDVSVPLSAIDGSTTFSFTGPGGDGYIIDYVRLDLIPAPTTIALLVLGGLVGRRRRGRLRPRSSPAASARRVCRVS